MQGLGRGDDTRLELGKVLLIAIPDTRVDSMKRASEGLERCDVEFRQRCSTRGFRFECWRPLLTGSVNERR